MLVRPVSLPSAAYICSQPSGVVEVVAGQWSRDPSPPPSRGFHRPGAQAWRWVKNGGAGSK